MSLVQLPRLMLAGTKSGVGKSSLATGIMQALTDKGLTVQGFKVGPDYVDPGFHTLACDGRYARNLDYSLLGEERLKEVFWRQAKRAALSIIEGVMGLFDGNPQELKNRGSTAAIAKILKAPVLLVVDCSSIAQSVAALVKGYIEYDPEVRIKGLILNQVASSRHEELLRNTLRELPIPIVGVLHQNSLPLLPAEGAGLSPARRGQEERRQVKILGQVIAQKTDLELLCKLAAEAPLLEQPQTIIYQKPKENLFTGIKIGYALDQVFCFYYQDTLDYLEFLGVRIIPFSPLQDPGLPRNLDGLLLGGGFLEHYAHIVSANKSMLENILAFGKMGKPVYAEGAGFEYLTREFVGQDGDVQPMVGLIPARTIRQASLTALGYYRGRNLAPSIIGMKGSFLQGHQYRRTVVEGVPILHQALELSRGKGAEEKNGYLQGSIFASHLYQHWVGQPKTAATFLKACLASR